MDGIDLRSDTVTKPTPEMRRAMYEAEVGDDGLEGDPTTRRLEELAAEHTGTEAGLLVASGSMGNLVSALSQVSPGEAMLIGKQSHMAWSVDQAHGHPTYAQISVRILQEQNGAMPLEDVELSLKDGTDQDDRITLVCIENTHNGTNGMPLDVPYLDEVSEVVKRKDARLHVDGARLFNASVALGLPAAELVGNADSVTFCLSKGLACPIGSVICGSTEFVEETRKQRKIVGGEMRQTGIISAAGIVALETMIDRLVDDHANAKRLAEGLADINGIVIDLEKINTNIVFFETKMKPAKVIEEELRAENVHCFALGNRIRMVTHYEISRDDVDSTLMAVQRVMWGDSVNG